MKEPISVRPIGISMNKPDPLDRVNTYVEYIQTNHSGIEAEIVYTATGAEILTMLQNAMYHAHSNGRARERQLDPSFSKSG